MVWELDSSDGRLELTTGVTGPAARMGHRLTIAMAWRASVQWSGDEPTAVELTVDVDSLEVVRGEGGVTPLSGPEKAVARANALKVLDGKKFPHIVYRTSAVAEAAEGYVLTGTLQIRDRVRDCAIDLRVEDLGDSWRMSCDAVVSHADFGLKPYSLMMGAMKVADEVAVSFTAERAKTG
ncbi:S-adenosyl-L-methionine-dependent methyltransferase [Mycolicibacterium duvalii]|uniref:Polyisoprenoid-binding protein n=1 Tax=Mycolicibacterium duvalii TaxID=39688 RepID=A0A7I7K3B8_9MYCO|nr:YceI family protein [Mycolicibacterium duvalii]MCV7367750.1 YceI family protein [Mycolicibacterium duvalii]PEG39424.1 S-adenosyl-L-methionine-dependent methyltransferase [Mycolicibacterium duvalii]BBX18660.1 polyisoprenoid-binding protein [Mycolicibacterium duvalii]